MILLLGVCVTVTLTYLFSLVLFPFHLSSCEQREKGVKGLLTPPSYVRVWKRNMETLMGVFWRDHKGIMACMGWVYLFFCVDVLVLRDKHA